MSSEPTARLCVYCGSKHRQLAGVRRARPSSSGRRSPTVASALVYGGGRVGLMGIVADAALAAGGEVVGVITEQLVGAEVAHTGLTRLEVTTSMHERKARLTQLADGFLVLPGGFGTLDELAEVLTWNQLGIIAKPVVLVDVDGYWGADDRVDGAQRSLAGFVRSSHRMLAQHAHSVDEAIAMATTPVPEVGHKWLDRDGTPAMGMPVTD